MSGSILIRATTIIPNTSKICIRSKNDKVFMPGRWETSLMNSFDLKGYCFVNRFFIHQETGTRQQV